MRIDTVGRYNFDTAPCRRGTNSLKWDCAEGVISMGIADMDFETAPEVKAAVLARAEHGIYGYSVTPDEFFTSIADFFERRHGYRFDTCDMVYSSGIVAAISSAVRKLTTPAEKVLIQPPVFNLFYNSVYNNGRYTVESELVRTDGGYEIDFEDLEAKLADPQVSLFILCNPHNPVGKVYTKDELCRIGELCHRHGVTVLSDEIHCEFTSPAKSYVPFASASETCRDISVTCVSASKSFNLAGMYAACVIAHNPVLRWRMYRALNTDEVGEPGVFSTVASIAAFTGGEAWLDELLEYIEENKRFAAEYIAARIPELHVTPSRATYLLWIDAETLGMDSPALAEYLEANAALKLSDGLEYGECGRYFLRMNVACPRATLEEGLRRLERGVRSLVG